MRRCIVILVALLIGATAYAGGGVPGVRTEWGVVAGVHHPLAKFNMGDSSAELKANTGFAAGLHMGLRIVGILGIQPEIIYSYNKIALKDEKQKFNTEIKCNTLQVPLLVSLKAGLVRFNVGPVFTLMDNPTYLDRKGEKVMFGRVYPTVSYSAGVSVCLLRRLLIDARVGGGFMAVENCLSYDIAAEGEYIKTTMFNAQLKVGILF